MKRLVSLFFAALTVLLFSVPVAEAQTSNYAVLKAGAYFPNSSDLNSFNTGFNGEVAFGHYFNQNFAAELALGYFQSSGKGPWYTNYTATGDIYAVPLTVALKAIYPIDKWEVYAIGGMGAYYCKANVDFTGSGIAVLSQNGTFALGGFLGAGANLNLDHNWFIGLEGRYLWVTPEFTVNFANNVGVSFDGWVLTGNLGYRF